MPVELTLLGATLVLALVHVFAAAHVRTRRYGIKWNMSSRDEASPPPTPLIGRLERAQANLYETLPLFAGALLAAGLAGRFDWRTEWGAHLYFWARLAYLPIYAASIVGLRSAVFGISFVGLVLILWALLAG